MTVTTANLAMGPGTLYVGDYGATEPADGDVSSAPASADWTDVGGTLGGLTFSVNQSYKALEVDQVPMEVGARRTKVEVTFKAKLAEVTMTNLTVALNGDSSTDVTSGSGYSRYSPDMSGACTEPNYRAIIFDGCGPNGKRRRVIVRRVLNTDTVALDNSVSDQQGYQVTLTGYYVSSSVKPYVVIDAV